MITCDNLNASNLNSTNLNSSNLHSSNINGTKEEREQQCSSKSKADLFETN